MVFSLADTATIMYQDSVDLKYDQMSDADAAYFNQHRVVLRCDWTQQWTDVGANILSEWNWIEKTETNFINLFRRTILGVDTDDGWTETRLSKSSQLAEVLIEHIFVPFYQKYPASNFNPHNVQRIFHNNVVADENKPGYVNFGDEIFTERQVREIHDDLIQQAYLVREETENYENGEKIYKYRFATVQAGDTIGIIVNYHDKKIPAVDTNEDYKQFTLCFEHNPDVGLNVDNQYYAEFQRRLIDAMEHPNMLANVKRDEALAMKTTFHNYFTDATYGVLNVVEYDPATFSWGQEGTPLHDLQMSIYGQHTIQFEDLLASQIRYTDDDTVTNLANPPEGATFIDIPGADVTINVQATADDVDKYLADFQKYLDVAKAKFSSAITDFRSTLVQTLNSTTWKSKFELWLAHEDAATRDDRRHRYNDMMYNTNLEKEFIKNAFALVYDIVY